MNKRKLSANLIKKLESSTNAKLDRELINEITSELLITAESIKNNKDIETRKKIINQGIAPILTSYLLRTAYSHFNLCPLMEDTFHLQLYGDLLGVYRDDCQYTLFSCLYISMQLTYHGYAASNELIWRLSSNLCMIHLIDHERTIEEKKRGSSKHIQGLNESIQIAKEYLSKNYWNEERKRIKNKSQIAREILTKLENNLAQNNNIFLPKEGERIIKKWIQEDYSKLEQYSKIFQLLQI